MMVTLGANFRKNKQTKLLPLNNYNILIIIQIKIIINLKIIQIKPSQIGLVRLTISFLFFFPFVVN